MITFALHPQSLSNAQRKYTARMNAASSVAINKCHSMREALYSCKTSEDLFGNIAEIYSLQRGNPSVFMSFDHWRTDLKVESVSGMQGNIEFPSDTPNVLATIALKDGKSVHVSQISGIDSRSMDQHILESGGSRITSDCQFNVELVDDNTLETERYFSPIILSVLPVDFSPIGSILLTPLGVGVSEKFGLGLIWEHGDAPFSESVIRDARLYASLFTLEITGREMTKLSA